MKLFAPRTDAVVARRANHVPHCVCVCVGVATTAKDRACEVLPRTHTLSAVQGA